MCISIAIPDHLSIANHANCHHSSGMDLGLQSEPQNIWGQQAWQTWADINGASSLVNLAHGIPWAILGPTPNFQHFFYLILSLCVSPAEIIHLRLNLNPCTGTQSQPEPTAFKLRSDTQFQDLMTLRFFMSHCRNHSVQFSCSVVSNSLQPHGLQKELRKRQM